MKKLLFFIIFIPAILLSQDINNLQNKKLSELNDNELLEYWVEAQDNGYTIEQIKILARSQGVSENEIIDFEKRINMISPGSNQGTIDLNSEFDSKNLTSIFGKKIEDRNNKKISVTESKMPFFGSNFFNNKNISSAPQLNIATPSSYELGPGDQILISIWGAAENEYSSKITREGYIKIERIGPVYVSGLTISEAENKLKRTLSKIYSGLGLSNNSDFKVFLDLSLINTRSIIVNVTGNVIAPDTYTISSLASILNVLYAAGGPNEAGSYRNINIIRNGKIIKSVDLYNYFSKGQMEPISLRDQDVILVPDYSNRIFLNGEFKNTGIFEVKNGETLEDILKISGGISTFGFKEQLIVKRTDGLFRKINNVKLEDFSNFILKDGDIIESRPVTDFYVNLVSIEGPVSVPGDYSTNNVKNVYDLIKIAGGLKEFAFNERAYLFRKIDGVENKIISFKLSNSENINIKANDRIVISSKNDLTRSKSVSIRGEVFSPGNYPFFNGMTLADLILISNGITTESDLKNINIYRSSYDETRKSPIETINISANGDDFSGFNDNIDLQLYNNDLVVIRKKLGYQDKEYISVEGLVKYPGIYALRNNNYSFYDLIIDFNGFLDDASLNGVKIIRQNKLPLNSQEENYNSDNINEFNIISDSLNLESKPYIEFGVDVENILKSKNKNSKYDVILKSGDRIIVPKQDNTIQITGAVQQSSVVNYSKSLTTKSAINKAGGFNENAKKNNVYVVYQNGDISSTKSFLLFKFYPKLESGAKIIVPLKNLNKSKTSVAEIVGYTTSLVSIIALIKSL